MKLHVAVSLQRCVSDRSTHVVVETVKGFDKLKIRLRLNLAAN